MILDSQFSIHVQKTVLVEVRSWVEEQNKKAAIAIKNETLLDWRALIKRAHKVNMKETIPIMLIMNKLLVFKVFHKKNQKIQNQNRNNL